MTRILPVPTRSPAVTAPPPKVVSGTVLPFSAIFTGRVAVVPVGMALVISNTINPIPDSLRNPNERVTSVVDTVTSFDATNGMPRVFIVIGGFHPNGFIGVRD